MESLLQDKLHYTQGSLWSASGLHLNFIFFNMIITKSSLDILCSFSPLYFLISSRMPTFFKLLSLITCVQYINYLSLKNSFKHYILLIFLPQTIIQMEDLKIIFPLTYPLPGRTCADYLSLSFTTHVEIINLFFHLGNPE